MADDAEEAGTQKAAHQCVHTCTAETVTSGTLKQCTLSQDTSFTLLCCLITDNGSDHVLPA